MLYMFIHFYSLLIYFIMFMFLKTKLVENRKYPIILLWDKFNHMDSKVQSQNIISLFWDKFIHMDTKIQTPKNKYLSELIQNQF